MLQSDNAAELLSPDRCCVLGESAAPEVRTELPKRLPYHLCGIVPICNGDLDFGPVYGQSFAADAAWAQDNESVRGGSMQTHRCQDGLTQAVCRTEGLKFVARFDCRVEHLRRGAGRNRAVSQKHRSGALLGVVGKPLRDQFAASFDGRITLRALHAATVSVAHPRARHREPRPAATIACLANSARAARHSDGVSP